MKKHPGIPRNRRPVSMITGISESPGFPVTRARVSRNPNAARTGIGKVKQGDKTTNFWAFQRGTGMMNQGTYAIKMLNDENDMKTRSQVFRGMNTSRVFTVREQVS